MSHQEPTRRRPYGTGTLYQKAGSWYGRWLVGERRMSRKLGPVRQPRARDGLTRSQAERELRRRGEQEHAVAATSARLTVKDAGERYLHHLEQVMQRAPSTVQNYRIMLDRLLRHQGARPAQAQRRDRLHGRQAPGGPGPEDVRNHVTFLDGLMKWSVKRGWVRLNPVAAVDRPPAEGSDPGHPLPDVSGHVPGAGNFDDLGMRKLSGRLAALCGRHVVVEVA